MVDILAIFVELTWLELLEGSYRQQQKVLLWKTTQLYYSCIWRHKNTLLMIVVDSS